MEIFYNIWAKFWDLDYSFLGDELIDLIGKWLEVEKLNAPNHAPLSPPFGPSAKDVVGVEGVPAGASEQ